MADQKAEINTREADNLDLNVFSELVSTCTMLGKEHTWTPPSTPETPKYFMKVRAGWQKAKPELELHLGRDKSGPIVGSARLHLASNEMCIGDHNRVMEEGDAISDRYFWERLVKQAEKFQYGIYEFEYGNGSGGVGSMGERVKYTWRRSVCGWRKEPREWELRVGGREVEDGELLAVWKRLGKWTAFKKGSLFVKSRFDSVESERKKWEVAVIMSMMIIIETYVRRQ